MHKVLTIFQGSIIQTKKAGTDDGALISPDYFLEEHGLSIFFYHWHEGRIPLLDMDRKGLKYDDTDMALHRMWSRALERIILYTSINKIEPHEILSFYIEEVSFFDHLIRTYDSKIEKKKINISLCQMCRKAINIHLSRSVKYCPNCAHKRKKETRQVRRAMNQGRGVCERCGVALKKSSQPIQYCSDKCRTYARREKARIRKYQEDLENFSGMFG
jgi:hypothetical protein